MQCPVPCNLAFLCVRDLQSVCLAGIHLLRSVRERARYLIKVFSKQELDVTV